MADAKTFRGSRSQTFSISRDEIERADDFGEIFDIAETLGVDLTGLDEINDMKTRLLLYYKKCEGEPNYKDVVSIYKSLFSKVIFGDKGPSCLSLFKATNINITNYFSNCNNFQRIPLSVPPYYIMSEPHSIMFFEWFFSFAIGTKAFKDTDLFYSKYLWLDDIGNAHINSYI